MPEINEIPFTKARPTEAGAYWYKNNEGQLYLIRISIDLQFKTLRCYVNGEYFWLDSFIGQWSPKLIPSTALNELQKQIDLDTGNIKRMQEAGDRLTVALDEAKRRIGELEARIIKLNKAHPIVVTLETCTECGKASVNPDTEHCMKCGQPQRI